MEETFSSIRTSSRAAMRAVTPSFVTDRSSAGRGHAAVRAASSGTPILSPLSITSHCKRGRAVIEFSRDQCRGKERSQASRRHDCGKLIREACEVAADKGSRRC